MHTIQSVVAAAALAALAHAAHGDPLWNRAAEAVAILPGADPGSPSQIVFYFSVAATVIEDQLDLSTGAQISINGNVVHTQVFAITANASGDPACTGLPCHDQPCLCQDDPPTCRCSPMVRGASTTALLQPGDVITGTTWAPGGAAPENNTSDDTHTQTFDGASLFWNRSVVITDVDPVPGPAFTIGAEVGFDVNYDGLLDLSTEVHVLINGVITAGLILGLNDQQLLLCGDACFVCWAFGSCTGAGSACVCRATFQLTFNAVPAAPGDELIVRVVPGTGALPALPGYELDDEQTMLLCPWDCGDADGTVGIVDFLALLGAWGAPGGPCDLGLGTAGVGVEEFLDMLAHWGPCTPP